jgi:hypothetical protein
MYSVPNVAVIVGGAGIGRAVSVFIAWGFSNTTVLFNRRGFAAADEYDAYKSQ